MEKYEIFEVIGEGTYGKVVRAQNKESGEIVAIKKFKDTENNQLVKRTALREIRTLKMLKHPNIVSLLEVVMKDQKIFLVFEYIESTVLELVQRSSVIDYHTSKKLVFQLIQALYYCHSLGVIHRDIKPENLLVSATGVLKLCDFGFARKIKSNPKLTNYVSTRWYRSPELLVGGGNYSFPVDIWGIGCVFYEMLTGKPLFPGFNDVDTLFREIRLCGNLTEEQKQEFFSHSDYSGLEFAEAKFKKFPIVLVEFFKSCLEMKPDLRPKCIDLLSHPIFEESLKNEFDKDKNQMSEKKIKRKGFVNPTHTPEPKSYLKMYEKKKSPKNFIHVKNSEERIRFKKNSPILPNFEKSSLFPEISRHENSFIQKRGAKYVAGNFEIKPEGKTTNKTHGSIIQGTISRNQSLSNEPSIETLTKPLVKSEISIRSKNPHRQDLVNSPTLFQGNLILPHKYRLKRRQNS